MLAITTPSAQAALTLLILLATTLPPTLVAQPPPHTIWADSPVRMTDADGKPLPRPIQIWEKNVYPIGNGRLGATVHGEPQREHLQFNEDSLWVGNEDCTGGYQPFGDVYIELPHAEFSDYRRELDLARAVHTVRYRSGGVRYTRETFVSHPAQVLVCRLTADREGALTGRVRLDSVHDLAPKTDGDDLVLQGDTSQFWWWQVHLKQPARLLGSREYASDQNIDLQLEARLRAVPDGGSVRFDDDAIVFEGCSALTLLLSADTDYLNQRDAGWRGKHPHDRVLGWLDAAAERPYGELLREHVADQGAMFSRLQLDVGQSPAEALALPTAARVARWQQQKQAGLVPDDRDLEELCYQYARYLMLGCSRPGHGALPANLQGLWLNNRRPAWRCDYHTDVNVQMNYWFVDGANLGECFLPLAQWIDSIREVRKEETRKVLGVQRGWLMRSENGVFGGSTWHFQKGDSAWLCQNLWDHYRFSQDRAWLQRYAYPVMKEISEFWVDHLSELPDGTLVAPDGRSPEHGPEKADGVSYDQQLCWDLFSNTIDASEALDVDADHRELLRSMRARLLGPKVGSWGQLQEWAEDIDDPKDQHRHINHMVAVYPGRQIHPSTTPDLAAAARVSLLARGNGPTGWSKAWRMCCWARLGDGERAHELLQDLMATKLYGNLWTTHPPFQIDSNFGLAAGIQEMLVQSHLDAVELLPALPAAWSDGGVRGLRLRGGFELALQWQHGELQRASITGVCNDAAELMVRYRDRCVRVEVARGDRRTLLPDAFADVR